MNLGNIKVHPPNAPRNFTIVERNTDIPDGVTEATADLIRWKTGRMAMYRAHPGRSLYVLVPYTSNEERTVTPVKLKGAGGVREESDGLHLYPPQPERLFSPFRQPHFIMSEGFELGAELGSRKAMQTAHASPSANEYHLHKKAYDHGIGFPPILHGNFDGEKDLEGRETGAVAVMMDPHYQTIAESNAFSLHMHEGSPHAAYMVSEKKIGVTTLSISANIQAKLCKLMAATKRASIMKAGIVRHAGHVGNYLINRDRNHVVITDLDSAADISTIDAASRPFQILRDVSHDLWRSISRHMLTYQMEGEIIQALNNPRSNPLYEFLSGYFDGVVDTTKIQQVSLQLLVKFKDFLKNNKEKMQACLDTHREVGNIFSQTEFSLSFYPFFTHCITACYQLMREDGDAQKRGYSLPAITEADLEKKSEAGIQRFLEIGEEESERGFNHMNKTGAEVTDYLV